MSLKPCNAGINLTAADYVFLFDPWWNSAVEQQAIDRTHRIGQTNVFAYKLICKDSIEERIIQLQEQKKNLAGSLISEEDVFVKALTETDIEFLLGLRIIKYFVSFNREINRIVAYSIAGMIFQFMFEKRYRFMVKRKPCSKT